MLAFDDLDQELWDEDPEEYIRKGYDIIEDIYSPKTSAVALLCGLCGTLKSRLESLRQSWATCGGTRHLTIRPIICWTLLAALSG